MVTIGDAVGHAETSVIVGYAICAGGKWNVPPSSVTACRTMLPFLMRTTAPGFGVVPSCL